MYWPPLTFICLPHHPLDASHSPPSHSPRHFLALHHSRSLACSARLNWPPITCFHLASRSPTQRCSPCPLLCYPLAYMASSLSRARAVPALPYHLVGRSLALLCYGQLVGLRQPNSRCPLSVPTSSGLSPFCAHRLAYALAASPPACSLCHPASCSPSARPSPLFCATWLLHTLSCTHPSETMCARFPYRLHTPNSRYRLVVLPSMDIDVICSGGVTILVAPIGPN